MIFVTVGQMVPFDRLIKAVDLWAADKQVGDIFAQIGATQYRPEHMKWVNFLNDSEFVECVKKARAVVAHAGTGTIITSLMLNTPILTMPRRASLKETRTDHQCATARKFSEMGYIDTVFDEKDLSIKLDEINTKNRRPKHIVGSQASPLLMETIRDFIR